jgi:NAD(P)-dependent dehydrogenase (short-subunit alcohol dehydrogenase family)
MPVALITGASRGFGYALASALAAQGWDLVIDAREPTALAAAADRLRSRRPSPAEPVTVVAVPGDVADPAHRTALAGAVGSFAGLDLLVNNASVLGPSPQPALDRYPIADLEHVLRVNAVAPLALTQALLPQLVARAGTVVNLSSDAAVEAYPGWGGYGASKAALDQITAIFAAEQPDLPVYAFDPGDMRTDMHQQAFPGEDISDRPLPETVVPALLRLLDTRPPSGRYRAGDLLHEASAGAAAGAGQ